ncbi:MAG: GNAT family N-acetyltransferase [Rhodobacteraceae bacterium]|nr:GNAT family N-acetyltransferase [Paracoccaceae bacterium]
MEIRWHNDPPDHWAFAYGQSAAPMQQHPLYGAAMAALGCRVRYAGIGAGGVALTVSRRIGPLPFSLIGRGPLWADPRPEDGAAAAGLRRIARDIGLLACTLETGTAGKGLWPVLSARHQAVLDLAPDVSALRAGLGGQWRSRLRGAEANGRLTYHAADPGRSAVFGQIVRAEADQRRDRRYRALPPAFIEAWLRADPRGARFYWAGDGEGPVAGALILLHHPGATYHLAWANQAGRSAQAPRRLLWQAILDLKDDGYGKLDLGDVNTEDTPGIARFKIDTGARVAPLGATVIVRPALIRRRS